MKTLTAVGLSIVLAPITAIISAWTMSTLWKWFVFHDYGDGPSYPAWFGLSMILSTATSPSLMSLKKEDATTVDDVTVVIVRYTSMWIGFAAVVGLAWVVGFALHWN